MRMKVIFFFKLNVETILIYSFHIGSSCNAKFASFTFLTTIALTAPHHSESAVAEENFLSLFGYKVYRFL